MAAKDRENNERQTMFELSEAERPYVTECPKCRGPLVNVDKNSLCPAGCGGLHPALTTRDARINKGLSSGELTTAMPLSALRLDRDSRDLLGPGASSQLWHASGKSGVWVRLPSTKENRDRIYAVRALYSVTGQIVTLVPLDDCLSLSAVLDVIAGLSIKRLSTDTEVDEIHPAEGVLEALRQYAKAYVALSETLSGFEAKSDSGPPWEQDDEAR